MRLRLRTLRSLIRESVEPRFEETVDDRYYVLDVESDKTFDLPDGTQYVAQGYNRSQLRARIDDTVMVIVSMQVTQAHQGGALAMQMLKKAAAHAKKSGLRLVSSGVYSPISKALLTAFERRGLVRDMGGYHEFDMSRL